MYSKQESIPPVNHTHLHRKQHTANPHDTGRHQRNILRVYTARPEREKTKQGMHAELDLLAPGRRAPAREHTQRACGQGTHGGIARRHNIHNRQPRQRSVDPMR